MTEHNEASLQGVSSLSAPGARSIHAPSSTVPSVPLPTATVPTANVPAATVSRLAVYLRELATMSDEGAATVSSEQLAHAAGVGSATLRKDLSFLGPNGVRGVGYDVAHLRDRIESLLGLERGHRVIVIGAGNLGRALAGYSGFDRRGFSVVGVFDVDPHVIGTTLADASDEPLVVESIERLAERCVATAPTIAIVTVPDAAAAAVYDLVAAAGVRRILSFASQAPQCVPGVDVRLVDLAAELQLLSFASSRPDSLVGAHL